MIYVGMMTDTIIVTSAIISNLLFKIPTCKISLSVTFFRMKLLQLQKRQKQLLRDMKLQMEQFRGSVKMEEALEQLDNDTSSLEANMTAIKDQITDLKLYLDENTNSEN